MPVEEQSRGTCFAALKGLRTLAFAFADCGALADERAARDAHQPRLVRDPVPSLGGGAPARRRQRHCADTPEFDFGRYRCSRCIRRNRNFELEPTSFDVAPNSPLYQVLSETARALESSDQRMPL